MNKIIRKEKIIIENENEKIIIDRVTEEIKKKPSLNINIFGFLSLKIEDFQC